jgi:DNA mismatch repair protein MLH3
LAGTIKSSGGSATAADAAIAEPAILSLEEIEHALGGGGGGGPCSRQPVVPGTVTRDMLRGAAAIGQVDCKAVAARCSGGGVLLAIDQHAADERVRLEALQARVARELDALRGASPPLVAAAGTTSLLQTMALTPPRLLELSRSERVALCTNLPVVESWGWRVTSAGSGSGEQQVLPALHMACMPCVCGVALGALDLRLYLHQLSETASSSRMLGGSNSGGSGSINLPTPPGVLRVLRSRACRTAIMFGDKLDASASVNLVASLGQTALPFVCAHGRPTTAPLVDLVALRAANVLPVFRAPATAAAAAAAATAGETRLTLARLTALVKS